MQLSLWTKFRVGAYVVRKLITEPTFKGFNPNDAKHFYANANAINTLMMRNHPVFFSPHVAAWVVSLDNAATFAMARDPRFSVNFHDWRFSAPAKPASEQDTLEKMLNGLLMSLPPDEHMRIRRLVQPAFMPKNIDKLNNTIAEVVNDTIRDLKGTVNLVEITEQVPLTIIARLVGVPLNYQPQFKGLADAIMATYMPTQAPDPAVAMEGVHIVREVIEARRDNPGDDFISVLIATADEDNDRLSIEEVMAFVASLLAAGPDTTWHYLNTTMETLLKHPEAITRLRQEPARIPDAITEAQRYNYFAHSGGVRFAREDVEINGKKIEKGEMIKFNVNTANLDPTVFPNPEQYNMDRPNLSNAFVFGTGHHFCVGVSLARSIGRHFVEAFINQYPKARLVDEPEYTVDFISRKMTRLLVNVDGH